MARLHSSLSCIMGSRSRDNHLKDQYNIGLSSCPYETKIRLIILNTCGGGKVYLFYLTLTFSTVYVMLELLSNCKKAS